VAEERHKYRGGDGSELHDPGNDDSGQRVGIHGGGDEHGGDGDEQCSDTDGESGPGSAGDHEPAGESDSDGGTDGDVHGGGDRDRAIELSVAEERGEHRGSDGSELHDPGNHDSGQRVGVRGGGEQLCRDGDERFRDTDGESGAGSAGDFDATGESDSDGGTDGDVHGGGDRDRAIELSVAEERGEHRGSDSGELHDTGNDDGR
jgi:hypothetical protein